LATVTPESLGRPKWKVAIERLHGGVDFGGELGGFALSGVEQLLLLFASRRQGFQRRVAEFVDARRLAVGVDHPIQTNRRIFLKRSLRFANTPCGLLIPCAAAPEASGSFL